MQHRRSDQTRSRPDCCCVWRECDPEQPVVIHLPAAHNSTKTVGCCQQERRSTGHQLPSAIPPAFAASTAPEDGMPLPCCALTDGHSLCYNGRRIGEGVPHRLPVSPDHSVPHLLPVPGQLMGCRSRAAPLLLIYIQEQGDVFSSESC